MALDFYITDATVNQRYEINDVVDIQESRGNLPAAPYSGPFRIARVTTTKTKQEMLVYMEKGASKRRAYYLDTTKMSVADRNYWNTNRVIQTDEATAVSWLSKKPGQ